MSVASPGLLCLWYRIGLLCSESPEPVSLWEATENPKASCYTEGPVVTIECAIMFLGFLTCFGYRGDQVSWFHGLENGKLKLVSDLFEGEEWRGKPGY